MNDELFKTSCDHSFRLSFSLPFLKNKYMPVFDPSRRKEPLKEQREMERDYSGTKDY